MAYSAAIVDAALLQQWLSKNITPQALEELLVSKEYEPALVTLYVNEYKKLRNSKRQNTGFIVLGLGALMGFIGCVMALINPIPELYNLFLYGLTMLAVIVIFIGFYFIFE